MPTIPESLLLGVTGASGAPYALRLLQALAPTGCRLSLTISDGGLLVLAHELGLDGGRDSLTHEFLRRAGTGPVRVFDPCDLTAPRDGDGTAAVVVCPCSMASAAHIALGTSQTVVHRAAEAALRERRPLVLVPRETPLSQIHLRRLLELSEAGAAIVPAMPAFYHRPITLGEAIDQVVGKVLAALGFEQSLFPAWTGGRS
jgi:4-hydroxy-3-polyprenylbenzoate decarboxylase